MQAFALALHQVSPKGYEYFKEKYESCLPSEYTLLKLQPTRLHTDEPSFDKRAFKTLEKEAIRLKNLNMKALCGLIMIEIDIKESVEYSDGKFYGLSDLWPKPKCLASKALFFMVVSLESYWSMPIGYFFIDDLSVQHKSQIVNKCLALLHKSGV